jgi:drug/metabolite transporter (DMT)-like permease
LQLLLGFCNPLVLLLVRYFEGTELVGAGLSSRHSSPAYAPWVGFAFAITAAVGFSCKAILAKLAYRTGVDALTVLGLRMLFSLPAYLGMAWIGGQRSPQPLTAARQLQVAGLGVLGYYIASYLDFVGLTRISAGLERLILFLYPTIVLLLSALVYKRRIEAREWQAMVLGYAGIACVFVGDTRAAGSGALVGMLSVFGSCVAYSMYLVFAEGAVQKLGSLRFTGLAMSAACVVSLATFLLVGRSLSSIPVAAMFLCATMALFSTVLPTWLQAEAVRRIGAGRAALCGMIGPVTTVVLEVMVLGEEARLADAAGTALVIVSVLWLTRARSA